MAGSTQSSRIAKYRAGVERLLIPTLESKIRSIVREEFDHLERVMNARFEAVNARIDSLEKQFPAAVGLSSPPVLPEF